MAINTAIFAIRIRGSLPRSRPADDVTIRSVQRNIGPNYYAGTGEVIFNSLVISYIHHDIHGQ